MSEEDPPVRSTVPEVARTERLSEALRARKVHLLLVSSPLDVRYLTGFTGTNGLALISARADPSETTAPQQSTAAPSTAAPSTAAPSTEQSTTERFAAPQRFFTDFRYATQSAEQVPECFERQLASVDLLETALLGLSPPGGSTGGGRLGFDESTLTVKQHIRLGELLPPDWKLVRCAGMVSRLRQVKDAGELERIRAAAELADEALSSVLAGGVVGRTERELAIDLELRMRRLGAEAPSFPSIVAAGEHSALPHAAPRDLPIPAGVLLTIDWGAQHEGYCSDCTRTFATGRVSEEAKDVYELVRSAQAESLAAVRPGLSGHHLDRVARELIERAGHGEHFGHGLGHGVGLEVHEGPRLSRTSSDEPLLAGNVVTIEPGVYLPGRFGVRIEDLVAVTEHGYERFSLLPKELTVLE
jgi:Xaa-Pro aminopeptidase